MNERLRDAIETGWALTLAGLVWLSLLALAACGLIIAVLLWRVLWR